MIWRASKGEVDCLPIETCNMCVIYLEQPRPPPPVLLSLSLPVLGRTQGGLPRAPKWDYGSHVDWLVWLLPERKIVSRWNASPMQGRNGSGEKCPCLGRTCPISFSANFLPRQGTGQM